MGPGACVEARADGACVCGRVGDRGYIGVRGFHKRQYSALSVEYNGLVPGFKQVTYAHDASATQHNTGFLDGKNRGFTMIEF